MQKATTGPGVPAAAEVICSGALVGYVLGDAMLRYPAERYSIGKDGEDRDTDVPDDTQYKALFIGRFAGISAAK